MKFSAENVLKIIREDSESHVNEMIYNLQGSYSQKSDMADLKLEAIKLLAKNHIRFAELKSSKPTASIVKTIEKELVRIRKDIVYSSSSGRGVFGCVYFHDNVADISDMHYAIRLSQGSLKDIQKQYIWTEEFQKNKSDNNGNITGVFPDLKRVFPSTFEFKTVLDIADLKKHFMLHGKSRKITHNTIFEINFENGIKKSFNAWYLDLIFKALNTNKLTIFTNADELATNGYTSGKDWNPNDVDIAVTSGIRTKYIKD